MQRLGRKETRAMGRIGIMMSVDRADGQISQHFGKAEWMMVADTEKAAVEFVKNDGMNGKSAVETAIRMGLEDVIFTEIGNGAFGHLQAAGIRGWAAPEGISGALALEMLGQARLQAVTAATKQGSGLGCCCASRTGGDAGACCRS